MRTAVAVLNPREIPDCMEALRALRVPKLWLSYMFEPQATAAFNREVQRTDFDRYVVIADDCRPTQEALDRVLALHDEGHACVTGYSNFDPFLPFVNLCYLPLPPPPPDYNSYAFYLREQVDQMGPGPIPTTFAGLSFTCMSRDMWLRFPLTCSAAGGQCDYVLSWELQKAKIPIVAAPGAFVWHVKDKFGVYPDASPEKRLLIGEREPAATWTDLEKWGGA